MRKILALVAAVAMLSACAETEPEHHTGLTGDAADDYDALEEILLDTPPDTMDSLCWVWHNENAFAVGSYREWYPETDIRAVRLVYDDFCGR